MKFRPVGTANGGSADCRTWQSCSRFSQFSKSP